MSSIVKEMIKDDEGFRNFVYKDHLGNLTCGWGHYLREGSLVPEEICNIFFEQDYSQAVSDYEALNLDLDTVRRDVIISMLFQLGKLGVRKFTNMMDALYENNYEEAARQMKNSLWYTQCPNRADRLIKMMITGKRGE